MHQVTAEPDQGKLIRVEQMPIQGVLYKRTARDLLERPDDLREAALVTQKALLPIEHRNVIATLKMYQDGEEIIPWVRDIPLVPEENRSLVTIAKMIAKQVFPKL